MATTTTTNSAAYTPGPIPNNNGHLREYLQTELFKIAAAIELLANGHIDKTYVAPEKPRDGDLAYADGTTWNPGSGAGIYYYKASAWTFIA